MKSRNHRFFAAGFFLIFVIVVPGVRVYGQQSPPVADWCSRSLRPGLEKLKEIKINRPWFKVYDVGQHTYAITEPYNWEETIAYLILGKNKALLFDTGMGLDSISLVVTELTKLPVVVFNSHTHPDHIGGNNEFRHILAMDTKYTKGNAANGYRHDVVKWEVSPASFCPARLPHKDTAHYAIRPFKVTRFIKNGYIIDLGDRKIRVVATPGHTPDAVCLYDMLGGYLWCGDSFYEGPILLSAEETDLKAYQKSIRLMAELAARSTLVLPAHNLPAAQPASLIEAAREFDRIVQGIKRGKPAEDHTLLFDCGKFSYQIGSKFLHRR